MYVHTNKYNSMCVYVWVHVCMFARIGLSMRAFVCVQTFMCVTFVLFLCVSVSKDFDVSL